MEGISAFLRTIQRSAVVLSSKLLVRCVAAASTGVVSAVALFYAAVAAAAPPQHAQSGDRPLLPAVEKQQRLTEQMVRTEVERELRDARTRMANEPAAVQKDLALLAGRVAKVPGLNVQTRTQLRGQIARVVREAHRRALRNNRAIALPRPGKALPPPSANGSS